MADIEIRRHMNKIAISVTNSYDIKDQLKAAGFKFDVLSNKGWDKFFDKSDLVGIADCIRFAQSLGATLVYPYEGSAWDNTWFVILSILKIMNLLEYKLVYNDKQRQLELAKIFDGIIISSVSNSSNKIVISPELVEMEG